MADQPNPLPSPPTQRNLHLIGIGVTHSIAPPMHNTIATTLSKPWTFTALECPTLPSVLSALHAPSFAGAVITMPYKQSIIPHLTATDPHATAIRAVNLVYPAPAPDGRRHQLRGSNTDWEGVRGCLLAADPQGRGRGRPALVVGAGGASRAALYALRTALGVAVVYVLNRDAREVVQLVEDARAYAGAGDSRLEIIHVRSVAQARELDAPFYVVGTVPDVEAQSAAEIEMREMLEAFLGSRAAEAEAEAGVLLDMCFKPRETRMLKMGRARGWRCVQGTEIIGHQIGTQWGLWTGEGEAVRGRMDEGEAWRVLRRAAEESTMIN